MTQEEMLKKIQELESKLKNTENELANEKARHY